MKKGLTLLMPVLLMIACNYPSKNISKDDVIKDSLGYDKKLLGKWVQPIPGQEETKQGFELDDNKTAHSININTMEYEKWTFSKDTLFIWGHTTGLRETSSFVDTLLVKKLSESELVVSRLGIIEGDQEIYRKTK
ncbi:lipocalin family protein [Elizabethkingia miricola]|uniref:lipocalin family protein n=1 Tax=Elizabethkingia miricola TaxID=172045 RepID=UPI002ACD7DEE|nr:lipocalin family protein [Elizabethkingia miricola]WQM39446.1 lipocalin family protein [Elizabethkingia miricola]